jgi:hypothetical protein
VCAQTHGLAHLWSWLDLINRQQQLRTAELHAAQLNTHAEQEPDPLGLFAEEEEEEAAAAAAGGPCEEGWGATNTGQQRQSEEAGEVEWVGKPPLSMPPFNSRIGRARRATLMLVRGAALPCQLLNGVSYVN